MHVTFQESEHDDHVLITWDNKHLATTRVELSLATSGALIVNYTKCNDSTILVFGVPHDCIDAFVDAIKWLRCKGDALARLALTSGYAATVVEDA